MNIKVHIKSVIEGLIRMARFDELTAENTTYDNVDSDIIATTVKGALDELALRTPAV